MDFLSLPALQMNSSAVERLLVKPALALTTSSTAASIAMDTPVKPVLNALAAEHCSLRSTTKKSLAVGTLTSPRTLPRAVVITISASNTTFNVANQHPGEGRRQKISTVSSVREVTKPIMPIVWQSQTTRHTFMHWIQSQRLFHQFCEEKTRRRRILRISMK